MTKFTDQLGNSLKLDGKPERVISLVPSQSEFLWDIGVKEELIGITKFCIHPEDMFTCVERVGGTKKLDLAKIRALKPDLIIGNKEENEQSQIMELQKEFNVWMSDIYTFEDAFDMMQSLGTIFGKEAGASEIIEELKQKFSRVKDLFTKQTVAYFIWNKPYMLAADHTFINYVLNFIGFENVASSLDRYPELGMGNLKELNPRYCFLSSEPFPFNEKHVKELQKFLPASEILIVDGELFSWYGSRLLHLEEYIHQLKNKIRD